MSLIPTMEAAAQPHREHRQRGLCWRLLLTTSAFAPLVMGAALMGQFSPGPSHNSPGNGKVLNAISVVSRVAATEDRTGTETLKVIPDAALEKLRHASFQTYIFSSNPAWTTKRTITESRDPTTFFTKRLYTITYFASDHRHVVLVQLPTSDTLAGPRVKTGKIVYQSPNGFKVWSGPRDRWMAGILLNGAQAVTHEKASDKRTGYMLESPAGTFPALAINGPVTATELHQLINSLVPAKPIKK